ncbi:MAG: N-acetyltransferase [Alphaproteobacteria bacterium]|nr:N-acetyltransferase [Alphaproteobacteria bacterium]
MSASPNPITIRQVLTKADKKAFVELAYELNAKDPNWIPPLKDEVYGLITPGKNPWFEHGEAAFFLAERDGKAVGRISAQVDQLVLEHMGAGIGQWGMFEANSEKVGLALLDQAEAWLRSKSMTRSMGPFSIGIWDEPGLLVKGHDHPPTVMMGHNSAAYEPWVELFGYKGVKDLLTYDLDVRDGFPPLIQRIVAMGEKNARIRIRKVDKSKFDQEAALILGILNDAWSDNWGYIPLTPSEIAYAGKKLKPIVYEDLIRVAEVDGEPVAFMMTLPDLNELTRDLKGELFPFGFVKLLWRLRKPKTRTMRVPLMGVLKRLHGTRLASQLAFMMIEYIRRDAIDRFGTVRGEIGWVLEDNGPMISIADAIESKVNRVYRIYEKDISGRPAGD